MYLMNIIIIIMVSVVALGWHMYICMVYFSVLREQNDVFFKNMVSVHRGFCEFRLDSLVLWMTQNCCTKILPFQTCSRLKYDVWKHLTDRAMLFRHCWSRWWHSFSSHGNWVVFNTVYYCKWVEVIFSHTECYVICQCVGLRRVTQACINSCTAIA